VAAQTGLDEKTVRDIFNARAEFLGRWHRFETPRILGIDELYLNKRYRCILTNIEERTLLDLLATRRQDVVTNYLMCQRRLKTDPPLDLKRRSKIDPPGP